MKLKKSFKKYSAWLFRHSITVFSCVVIIALGITALTYADSVTTTIGENISTNSLTSTGLTVNGETTLATTTLSGDLDLSGNELKNSILEKLSSWPSSPVEGQMFYSTASSTPYWYTGSQWKGDVSGATFVVAASDSLNKEKADYICDGTADDVQIQAAIDALNGNGGSVVLMEGTFYINAPISISNTSPADDNVTLQGQGDSTVLKLPDGNSTSIAIIYISGGDPTVKNTIIRDLKIDGNKDNASGNSYGIYAHYTENVRIKNVTITNGQGVSYGVLSSHCTDLSIDNCYMSDWGINVIELKNTSRGSITNSFLEKRIEIYDNSNYIKISNNYFYNLEFSVGTDTGAGVYVDGLDISNNYFYRDDSVNTPTINLSRCRQTNISNNHIDVNDNRPITTGSDTSHTLIVGNMLIASGDVTIKIGVDTSHTSIVDNILISTATTVLTVQGSSYGLISNNKITTGATSYASGVYFYRSGEVNPQYWKVASNMITGTTTVTTYGVDFNSGGSNIDVVDNYIFDCTKGVRLNDSDVSNISILRNKFTNVTTSIDDSGVSTVIKENIGYTTATSSTATITSGNTYIAVTHSLDIQPATSTISVLPLEDLGNASTTNFWISDVGASTFRINVGTDPGKDVDFSWNIGSY